MITGETPGYDDATEGGGFDAPGGLVPGHAYSIIEAKEGLGVKLLKIRNPWGKYEWDGDWSDESDLWTDEMIDHFQPVFDTSDGTFWMSLEDFIMRYDSVNICQVRNWKEARLKGKFIRAIEKENDENEWVLNKFYYTFEVDQDETEIHIGLHQEDDRILGADRRRMLDIAIALFKIDDDNGEMTVIKVTEFCLEREIQEFFTLDEGRYIVVPMTTGALLQKPEKTDNIPIDFKVQFENITMPHPYFMSTMNDIFRKIDLALNGKLSAGELNQFGKIINNEDLKAIKQVDFIKKEFKKLS